MHKLELEINSNVGTKSNKYIKRVICSKIYSTLCFFNTKLFIKLGKQGMIKVV